MSEFSSLLDELERAVSSGTTEQRLTALERITDLFISGSNRYSDLQIALFDDVLLRLAKVIETEARARLSERLATVERAPPRVIRSLAFDDAIAVASPVLMSSDQLTEKDLVENASTKSQDHLYAISQRRRLSEAVTDVLVERGDQRVVRSVAANAGASFSDKGFDKLVVRSRDDDILAHVVGMRRDIPRHHFIKLLETASAAAQARLKAENPQAAALIREMVAEVAGEISRVVREASPEHKRAKKAAKRRYKLRQLTEGDIHARARAQEFEKTVVALALYGHYPVELVERALLDEGTDMILILAKAAGCSRTTTKALLLMYAAGRGMAQPDLERALASFDRLSVATAKRVIAFYEQRRRARAPDLSVRLSAPRATVPPALSSPSGPVLRAGT